jgi:hypothetical protein
MSCARLAGAILNVGGPVFKIRVAGKPILFEDHVFCGPLPCYSDGTERRVGQRHPFWDAVTRWYQSGRRVDREGWCVFEESTP